MYRINIYNYNFSIKLTSIFLGSDIYSLSYVNELNKTGSARFTIPVLNTKATTTNIKLYNKIKIYKNDTVKFVGYIENIQAGVNELEIGCLGILGIFKKRIITNVYYATTVQATFEDILDTINAVNDTGITFGVTTIAQVLNRIELNRVTVASVWNKLSNLADQAEYIINGDLTLDFKSSIGTDKSSSIILQYLVTQINTANVEDFEIEISGKDMVNKVSAVGKAIYSTKSDATSILNYGILEETLNEVQTYNQTDLDTEAQNYIDAHKQEFYIPTIVPNISKINIELFKLGDIIKLILSNGYIIVNQNEKIIKIAVDVSNNNIEKLSLSLVPITTNLLPSSFIEEDISSLNKRVSLLEGAL